MSGEGLLTRWFSAGDKSNRTAQTPELPWCLPIPLISNVRLLVKSYLRHCKAYIQEQLKSAEAVLAQIGSGNPPPDWIT